MSTNILMQTSGGSAGPRVFEQGSHGLRIDHKMQDNICFFGAVRMDDNNHIG